MDMAVSHLVMLSNTLHAYILPYVFIHKPVTPSTLKRVWLLLKIISSRVLVVLQKPLSALNDILLYHMI